MATVGERRICKELIQQCTVFQCCSVGRQYLSKSSLELKLLTCFYLVYSVFVLLELYSRILKWGHKQGAVKKVVLECWVNTYYVLLSFFRRIQLKLAALTFIVHITHTSSFLLLFCMNLVCCWFFKSRFFPCGMMLAVVSPCLLFCLCIQDACVPGNIFHLAFHQW